MPCSDGGWGRDEERRHYDNQKVAIQARLDNVTRLLCELCTHLDETQRNDVFASIAGLKGWWVEHQRQDAARKELEAAAQARRDEERRAQELREQAMNKLTDEERRVLGL